MLTLHPISTKKQQLIDQKNSEPIQVNEAVWVLRSTVDPADRSNKSIKTQVIEIKDDHLIVRVKDRLDHPVLLKEVVSRDTFDLGANPFPTVIDRQQTFLFDLETILHRLGLIEVNKPYQIDDIKVASLNWDPFIYDQKGQKQRYQRALVWDVTQKQLLIDSLYHNVDCGGILICPKSLSQLQLLAKQGETELFFYDIVDGKQRLDALRGFLAEEFPDRQGNYYGDLSHLAQRQLCQSMLVKYTELAEDVTDEYVLRQFLRLNFAGVPQSREHLEFVRSLTIKSH